MSKIVLKWLIVGKGLILIITKTCSRDLKEVRPVIQTTIPRQQPGTQTVYPHIGFQIETYPPQTR